jgi:hypothetical protein
VLNLVLGSMLLLWSHIVWLILLLLSVWRHLELKVVVPKAAALHSADGSGTDGSEDGGSKGGGGPLDDGRVAAEAEPAPPSAPPASDLV